MKDHLGQELQIGDWVLIIRDGKRDDFGQIQQFERDYAWFRCSQRTYSGKEHGWFGSSLEKISTEEAMIRILEL